MNNSNNKSVRPEQRLAEELQRERDNVQKAKVEKWQRLKRDYPIPSFLQNYVNEVSEDAEADDARDRFVNVAMLGDSGTGKSSLIKVILKHFGVDLPPDQMPKVSMEGDGTLLPTRFPLEKLGQVSVGSPRPRNFEDSFHDISLQHGPEILRSCLQRHGWSLV